MPLATKLLGTAGATLSLVRVALTKAGPYLLVAGKTAALLAPVPPRDGTRAEGKLATFSVVPFDLGGEGRERFHHQDRGRS